MFKRVSKNPDEAILDEVQYRAIAVALMLIGKKKIPASVAARLHEDPGAYREFAELVLDESTLVFRKCIAKFGLLAINRIGDGAISEAFREGFRIGATSSYEVERKRDGNQK